MVTTTQERAAEGETRPALSQQELRARALEQGAKQLASGPLARERDANPAAAIAALEKSLKEAHAKLDAQAKQLGEMKDLLQMLGKGVVGITDMLKGPESAKKSAGKAATDKPAGDAGGK